MTVSRSAAGTEGLSSWTKETSHNWFFCAQVDKHLPASVRRKLLQELKAKPCAFEALPSAGALAPGQRCNVRVRFSPTEEVRLATVTPQEVWQGSVVMRAQCREQEMRSTSPWSFLQALCPLCLSFPCKNPLLRGTLESRWGPHTGSIRALRCGCLSAPGGTSTSFSSSSPLPGVYLEAVMSHHLMTR